MNKVNFTPEKDIKQYLTDDFNISIYKELTQNGEWNGTFEPLEFFNIFYENIQIINSNIDNPLFFLRYIEGLGYDSKKLYYLLSNHLELLNYQRIKGFENEEIMTFVSYIEEELGKLSAILHPERVEWFENEGLKTLENFLTGGIDSNRYDFEKVKEIIDGFDDIYKKIKFLIEAKTEFLQNHTDFDFDKRFGEKCQIQINSLKELAKIDSEFNKINLPKQPQQPETKNSDESEHDVKKELHNNIFKNNAFDVWQSMYDEFEITESSRTDIKFMFEEMKKDGLIFNTVSQIKFLEWITSAHNGLIIERISNHSRTKHRLQAYARAKELYKN